MKEIKLEKKERKNIRYDWALKLLGPTSRMCKKQEIHILSMITIKLTSMWLTGISLNDNSYIKKENTIRIG